MSIITDPNVPRWRSFSRWERLKVWLGLPVRMRPIGYLVDGDVWVHPANAEAAECFDVDIIRKGAT